MNNHYKYLKYKNKYLKYKNKFRQIGSGIQVINDLDGTVLYEIDDVSRSPFIERLTFELPQIVNMQAPIQFTIEFNDNILRSGLYYTSTAEIPIIFLFTNEDKNDDIRIQQNYNINFSNKLEHIIETCNAMGPNFLQAIINLNDQSNISEKFNDFLNFLIRLLGQIKADHQSIEWYLEFIDQKKWYYNKNSDKNEEDQKSDETIKIILELFKKIVNDDAKFSGICNLLKKNSSFIRNEDIVSYLNSNIN
jgi:hypothetical protein